jgi:hypothetical protein
MEYVSVHANAHGTTSFFVCIQCLGQVEISNPQYHEITAECCAQKYLVTVNRRKNAASRTKVNCTPVKIISYSFDRIKGDKGIYPTKRPLMLIDVAKGGMGIFVPSSDRPFSLPAGHIVRVRYHLCNAHLESLCDVRYVKNDRIGLSFYDKKLFTPAQRAIADRVL